ncbi:unnamed protein product [Coffea canephora]|uniref:RING-type E3 ubiquitin transferase n=2 Tax=Coffea TaxID=13442 RepID=A0A068UD82_COFCA|nr:E3 ubiquitin-protein ligase Hakai-like [Coffea arabica]CDP06525.1 unnamed protein product [Coffea canephora]
MLQIRLRKPSSEAGGLKPLPADTVTVACPDHLVLADLPVAKCLGSPAATALVKIVGRRSRRQLGERVHFCVHCDLPIAVYGRLSPCDHVFCLDCARSDSFCFICDERIQKIQTIKLMEGIFICAAPHCLKSFLKKSDFESHILETHGDLLHPNAEKEGNDSEAASMRKSTASDSTVQAPPRPMFSMHSNSQVHDREAHRPQLRDQSISRPFMQPKVMPSFPGQIQNHSSEQLLDNNAPPGFDRLGSQNRFTQQAFDSPGGIRQDSSQIPEKQQGIRAESPFPEYPMQALQSPGFAGPVNLNPGLVPPQFVYPHFMPDGAQPFYGAPYDMARPESTPEVGSEQGPLLGFPPGPAGSINFAESYPRPWSLGPGVGNFETSPTGPGSVEGFMNNTASDPQGRPAILQGDYGRNPAALLSNLPLHPSTNKGMESGQSGTSMDARDGKGILAQPPLPLPPPPPFPPHLAQIKRGKFYSNETNNDGQGFGWPNEKRDSFVSNQE